MEKHIRFTRNRILESSKTIIEHFSSLLDTSFVLINQEGEIIFPKKMIDNNESEPNFKLINEQISQFKELLHNEEENFIARPIWIKNLFIGSLCTSPVIDYKLNYRHMQLAGAVIDEICDRCYELADTVNHWMAIQNDITILSNSYKSLNALKSEKEIAEYLLNEIVNKFNPKNALILLFNEHDKTLKVEAAHPERHNIVEISLTEDNIFYKIFQERGIEIINNKNMENETKIKKIEQALRLTFNKMMIVPLGHDIDTVGIVCIFDKEKGLDFYSNEINLISMLSILSGYAIIINNKFREEIEAWKEISFRSSHKFGNALFILGGDIQWLKTLVDEKSINHDELKSVVDDVQRSFHDAGAIVREFKQTMKTEPLNLEPVNINEVLGSIRTDIERSFEGKEISIQCSFSENLSPVQLDKTKFKQCISELIENACHAMKNSGEISIITSNFSDDQENNDAISIMIADTGHGVKDENKTKIFYPFFSTRAKGSGLGLSIIHKYIEEHGGSITEKGVYGKGAIFQIILPSSPLGE